MFTHATRTQRLGALILLATTWSTLIAGLDVDLCSDFNTAETPRNTSIYQTNGLCHDWCIDDYAYAITQEKSCWCSNYSPAESVQDSTSKCNIPCPAWPDENCGGKGLYGYVSLGNVLPSGTRAPEASSTTKEAEPTTAISRVTETVQNTVTWYPSTTSTSSSTSTSSTSSSSSSSSSSFSSSSETTTTTTAEETTTTTTEESTSTTSTSSSTTASETETEAETSTTKTEAPAIQTVTAGGTIQTVTIGPSQTGESSSESSNVDKKDSSLKTGQVVGIVVGVIVAVIGAAAIMVFLWLRRRKQQNEHGAFQDDPSIRGSESGMIGSTRQDMSMAGGSPGSQNSPGNRNSALHIDPRMDPFKQGLYVRNGSRESINTLRDDHDYSRKILRATNPDPEQTA